MKRLETNDFYDFAGFRVDSQKRLLYRGTSLVALTPKEFEVLFHLVARAGEVVEKKDLLNAVWADVFVEEMTLARNISWLRKKLGAASAGGEKLIETVPRRGYRFQPVIERIPNQSENQSENASENRTNETFVAREKVIQPLADEETAMIADVGSRISDAPNQSPPTANQNLTTNDDSRHGINPKSKIQNPKLWLFGALALAAVGFAVYGGYFWRAAPQVLVATRVAPFSGLTGRENFPAFSPDGKFLAYVWNGGAGDNFDVYVKQIGAGGAPVRLTATGADEVHPAFSPDGARVAFVRVFADHSEVFLTPSFGGAERKICDLRANYSRLSFAPDGRTVAVTDADDDSAREGIFLVDVETGAKRRLTDPPQTLRDIGARFSPDGKQIAFLRDLRGASAEVFVISATSDEPERQLTFEQTDIAGLSWSGDGERIVYASKKTALSSNLRRISARGGASELIATSGKNITNPIFAADDRTFAFVEQSLQTNILSLEPATSRARRLIESSGNDHSPQFSPDGSQIAFVSDRTGSAEIWIAGADGKNQRQLTDFRQAEKTADQSSDAPNSAGSPRFSPDGKWITFDAQLGGDGDVYVVPANGGAGRRLTFDRSQEILPAWSANGEDIYFASNRGGNFDLYKIPVAGADEAVQITKEGAFESYAAPDAPTIFYTKTHDAAGLWQVSATGGAEQSISNVARHGAWRYWTVTPAGIYYLAQSIAAADYKIELYDWRTGHTNTIAATEKSPIYTYSGLSVAPDGKTILYVQSEQNAGAIMLAETER